MTRKLRIALTVLSVGFALEGGEELYTSLTSGSTVPGQSVVYVLPFILALVGLVIVWVGRDEWSDVHRIRARMAGRVFFASLLGAFVAVGILALLVAEPSLGSPLWAQVVFGAAVGSLVFGTFVVYAYLVAHLVSRITRVAVYVALAWSFIISVAVAAVLASNLMTVLALIDNRTVAIPAFVAPVDVLASYLFISYFLFLAAYIEAHVAVLRGLVTVSKQAGVPVTRNSTSTEPDKAPPIVEPISVDEEVTKTPARPGA